MPRDPSRPVATVKGFPVIYTGKTEDWPGVPDKIKPATLYQFMWLEGPNVGRYGLTHSAPPEPPPPDYKH